MTWHCIWAPSPNVDIGIPIEGNLFSRVHCSIVDLRVERLPVGLAVQLPLGHVQSQVEAGQGSSVSRLTVAARERVVVLYPLQDDALVLN